MSNLLQTKSLIIAGLLASTLAMPFASSAAPASEAGTMAESVDLRPALANDGTFVGRTGVVGSVDASKWRLTSDIRTGEAPRFEPASTDSSLALPLGQWATLGSSADSLNGALNGTVRAMLMMGDDLYVGGNFTNAAGIAKADFIARWDGSEWHALGSNAADTDGALNSNVNGLAELNGQVYAVGNFTYAAGILQASYVARWSGTSWFALGSNPGNTGGAIIGELRAVAAFGGSIVVGGSFTNAAGLPKADYIARWDGAWNAVGSNAADDNGALTGAVSTLLPDGPDLYVGGWFSNVKEIAQADYVARWSGSNWFALGSDVPGTNGAINALVTSLAKFEEDLLIGGSFTNVHGIAAADSMVRWGGANDWSVIGTDSSGNAAIGTFGLVYDWAVDGTDLYAIGSFTDMADDPLADYLARWDGSSWHAVGSNGAGGPSVNTQSYALQKGPTELFVGGQFTNGAGLAKADHIVAHGLAEPQPDGRIKKASGSFVGNNIYNATGLNQTRTGKKAIGSTVTFTISIQNDGNTDDEFKVYAAGPAAISYQVTYFRGATDITGPVVTGAYQTPTLAPGTTFAITAKVKVLAGATVGSSVTRLVSINSVADQLAADAVKLVGKRK